MKAFFPALCAVLFLASCARDYVLPPPVDITPVETRKLEEDVKEHREKLSAAGESGKEATRAAERAAVTGAEVQEAVSRALQGAGEEARLRIESLRSVIDRLQADLASAVKAQEKAQADFKDLEWHFEARVVEEVAEVAKRAEVNRAQIDVDKKTDEVLREQAGEGLDAKAELVKQKERGKWGWWVAGAGWGIIGIYIFVRVCGAAVAGYFHAITGGRFVRNKT